MSKNEIIRQRLLEWSKSNYRDYPWRRTTDPYKILIAEIMLHRTSADQVNRIYDFFIEKYPDFNVINEANIEELQNDLKSLGLYWRVNNLKLISKRISECNNGEIPSSKEDLTDLPGIGDYIAGAYLISAHQKKRALLDSNIVRVISRVFGYTQTDHSRRSKLYSEIIDSILPEDNPRKFLYAILDFAHFICKSRTPDCGTCPLLELCTYGLNR